MMGRAALANPVASCAGVFKQHGRILTCVITLILGFTPVILHAQPVTFTEVTEFTSSIDFTEIAVSSGVDDSGTGRGAAWGDYDNDDDLDLYVVNSSQRNRLYRNNGNLPDEEVGLTAGVADIGSGFGAAWGDYNNDGHLDLYVARSDQTNRLYHNNGDGTFNEVAATARVDDSGPGRGVAWGDYDNDGHLDLYVVNDGANRLYHNNGDGTFNEVGSANRVNDNQHGQGAAWGDYNNDGHLDLYVSNGRAGLGFGGAPNRLYRNDGNGSFTEVGGGARVNDDGDGRGVAWGDYDNDGDLDLYLANSDETIGIDEAPNRLFRNDGDGSFTEIGAAANVNDDGDGRGVAWGDYDNDGWLDLYLINDGRNRLFRNDGSGRFIRVESTVDVDDTGNGTGGAWGDYNRDGWLDLYVVNNNQANRLYRNNNTGNRWLAVTLVGSLSNQSGIGAQVIAYTGATRQRRDVDGGSGYLSQPSLPVEFGFGGLTTVDSLVVFWPAGQRQMLTQVATDQRFTISEADIPLDINAPKIDLVLSSDNVTEGQAYPVTAQITDEARVRAVTLLYRQAGAPTWTDSVAMTHIGDSTFTATIPGSRVIRQGVLFSVKAQDPIGNVAVTLDQGVQVNFNSLRSTGFSLPAGDDLTVNDFRMISVPASLIDRNPTGVLGQNLNPSSPTTYNKKSWRLFRWVRGQYLEHPSVGQFDPGKAFWVIAHTPTTIDAGDAVSTTDRIRTVTLSPGWNQIGTPYLFPVHVSTILAGNPAGIIEPTMWHWTGSGYEQATELKPWHGYWIQSLASSNIELKIPIIDANLVTPKPVSVVNRPTADSTGWRLQLIASTDALRDAANYLGVSPQAAVQWDPFDISKPPIMGNGGLALVFPHDEWATRSGRYATDIQPVDKEGRFWRFTVESDIPDVPVTLEIKDIERLPEDASVTLIDTKRQYEQDVRAHHVYTFTAHERHTIRHFLLVVGPSSYLTAVRQSLAPTVVSLDQNRPNPFNPSTVISFALPSPAYVKLRVYNILGQEVRRLVDEVRPNGRHTVRWDGKNDRENAVAGGIYLYQLQVGTFVRTRKMVLLR